MTYGYQDSIVKRKPFYEMMSNAITWKDLKLVVKRRRIRSRRVKEKMGNIQPNIFGW